MKKITKENRQEVLNDNPKLVIKVGATWCGPCKTYDQILKVLPDTLAVYSCDMDDNADWVAELRINAVPTTILFENGVEIKRMTGVQSVETIASLLR